VSDVNHVLVAFKCCIEADDHIFNKIAVSVTGRHAVGPLDEADEESEFRGRISHVEMLIKQRETGTPHTNAEWHRYSIMKKTGKYVNGKVVFFPGKVHSIKTGYVNGKMQVTNYRFYRLDLGVDAVNDALSFLNEQVRREAGFNRIGYIFNFVTPVLFGISHYKQAERRKENTWFCTELIVCALQAAGMSSFALRKACAISPNELFDLIAGGDGRHVFSGHYF
jgi:hypothetical protein